MSAAVVVDLDQAELAAKVGALLTESRRLAREACDLVVDAGLVIDFETPEGATGRIDIASEIDQATFRLQDPWASTELVRLGRARFVKDER